MVELQILVEPAHAELLQDTEAHDDGFFSLMVEGIPNVLQWQQIAVLLDLLCFEVVGTMCGERIGLNLFALPDIVVQLQQYHRMNKLVEFFQTEVSLYKVNPRSVKSEAATKVTQVEKWLENAKVGVQGAAVSSGTNSPAGTTESKDETQRSIKKMFVLASKKTKRRIMDIEKALGVVRPATQMSSKSQDKQLSEHRSMFILKGASASYAQQKERLQDRVRNLTLNPRGKPGGSSNRLAKLIWSYKNPKEGESLPPGRQLSESLPAIKLKHIKSDTVLETINPPASLDVRAGGVPIRAMTDDNSSRASAANEMAGTAPSSPGLGREGLQRSESLDAKPVQKNGYGKVEEHQRSRITRKFEMLTKRSVAAHEWNEPMLPASAIRRSLVDGPPGMVEAEVDIIFKDCISCDGEEDPLVSLGQFSEVCIRALSWQKLTRSPFGGLPPGTF